MSTKKKLQFHKKENRHQTEQSNLFFLHNFFFFFVKQFIWTFLVTPLFLVFNFLFTFKL